MQGSGAAVKGLNMGSRAILALCLAGMLLAGCSAGLDPLSWLQPAAPTPSPSPARPAASATPNGQPARTATPTRSPAENATPGGPQTLIVWVPAQFDPANSPGGERLKARLAAFETENPGLKIQLRVKAASGAGGLVESLAAASAAAPSTLPALVALPRADLETAALKGLVFPLDGLTRLVDDSDWYAYARQLALIQGAAFGLPFAGDSLLLLYRAARFASAPPADWAGLTKAGFPVAFAAADSQALTTLLLYLSAGGQVKDSQGRPSLQTEPLTRVLKQYADGVKAGLFPLWLTQTQTDGQAWQAYREQRAQLLITWSSRYMVDLPADTAAVPIPAVGGSALTLATGWVWALSDPLPERRALSVRLAESLVASDFMAQWSFAAGYLPTRPSALAAWSNPSLRTLLNPVLLSSQIRPPSDLLLATGPVLQDVTLQVLKGQVDPAQAAQAAVERLAASPSK